MMKAIS